MKKQTTNSIPVINEQGECLWCAPVSDILKKIGIDLEKAAESANALKIQYSSNKYQKLLLSSLSAHISPTSENLKDYAFSLANAGFIDISLRLLSSLTRITSFSRTEREQYVRLLDHRPKELTEELENISVAVEKWVAKHDPSHEAQFILYADINPNVVDGSSVWLSSIASLLGGIGKCVVVLKQNIDSDVIWSNIEDADQVLRFQPSDLNKKATSFSIENALDIISALDHELPAIRRVIVRGLSVGALLHRTSQFYGRACVYITDFYRIEDGKAVIPDGNRDLLQIAASNRTLILCQTDLIEETIQESLDIPAETFLLPPTILAPTSSPPRKRAGGPVTIGYAGKITPDWGVQELLDWGEELRKQGVSVELHICPAKYSDWGINGHIAGFSARIKKRLEREAILYPTMNRSGAMELMSSMDFVWCVRPPRLEEGALELSTKLVEMIAAGGRCLAYPGMVNKRVLGADYPFFVRNAEELSQRIRNAEQLPHRLVSMVREAHDISKIRSGFRAFLDVEPPPELQRRICIAGHDLKFIYPYLSTLKRLGHMVTVDRWEWGKPEDLGRSERLHSWADVIFCEWGLANAVWHTKNKQIGKRVVVRVHAQEVRKRAEKFGAQISISEADAVIFVNRNIRDRALALWKWPVNKTKLIPNFVLSSEYSFLKRLPHGRISLGMVGMVPQLKRPDRAVKVLLEAGRRGIAANLRIKGKRPEDLPFMHAPGRKHELEYYTKLYEQIEKDSFARENVIFDPWGNDMGQWYTKINVILSCSDEESFHYALADGVLAGCLPLVWPWAQGQGLYPETWIVKDVGQAIDKVEEFFSLSLEERHRILSDNRSWIEERFSHTKVFAQLSDQLEVYSDYCRSTEDVSYIAAEEL